MGKYIAIGNINKKPFPKEPAYPIAKEIPDVDPVARDVAFIGMLIGRHRHSLSRGVNNHFEQELSKFIQQVKSQAYSKGLKDMDRMHGKIDTLNQEEDGK